MKNEILQEVWRNRDDFAKQHNYDLKSMVKALQKSEMPAKNLWLTEARRNHIKKQRQRPVRRKDNNKKLT